jgi:uncharacterized protein (TIGR03067 family)
MKNLVHVSKSFVFVLALLLVWLSQAEVQGQGKTDELTREELKKEVAALRELLRWQGAFQNNDGVTFYLTGERWTIVGMGNPGGDSGRIKIVEVREKLTLADLVVEEGLLKGKTIKAIFHLDGDTLHFCGAVYAAERPTEFKGHRDPYYYMWTRTR